MASIPRAIDAIFLSHLHGDHFAGLPFLLLEQHFVGRRDRPLVIAGPAGTEQRVMAALEVFFPGSADLAWRFPLTFSELEPRRTARFGAFAITPYVVSHPSGSAAFAFRLKTGNRLIGYSGDTEWTDALLEVARDARSVHRRSVTRIDGAAATSIDYGCITRSIFMK